MSCAAGTPSPSPMISVNPHHMDNAARSLVALNAAIVRCRLCPRLVAIARRSRPRPRAAIEASATGRGRCRASEIPGARLLLVGLAPAAHGGNRTGRMFTGDRSGDWLFGALHEAGFANQATSTEPGDGLQLTDAYITATARCAPPANRPTPTRWTAAGRTCWKSCAAVRRPGGGRPGQDRVGRVSALAAGAGARGAAAAAAIRPRRGRGDAGRGPTLLGCFHPSQQNTFTGKLTRAMLRAVFRRARRLAARESSSREAT